MHYFIRRDNQEYGPYTLADLQRYAASGHVSPADEARNDADGAVRRVSEWLASAEAPAPSPFAPIGAPSPYPGAEGVFPQRAIPAGAYMPAYQKPTMANGAPLPPNFHWGWLLLLHFPTCGMITFVWLFMQAWWVKQLDRSSKAIWYLAAYLGVSYIIGVPASLMMNLISEEIVRDQPVIIIVAAAGVVLTSLGSLALFLIGVFSMRRSMLNYFNSVENIGLRLNGVMTFFFPIWYFQYHMSRIAQWKQTGVMPV